jgi:phosphoglycolate phosphatase
MIRNVIFDWSGTLVDDLPAVWEASNHVFRKAGVTPLTLEEFRTEFRLPYRGFYDKFVPHVPLQELEVWFHARFRECQDSVVALPHAREFLNFCRQSGYRTFLLSTVHPMHYDRQAEATGLGGFLDRTYTGVDDKRTRITAILEENQLDPSETVFIGDMEHDVETARHGGIRSVAVLTGYNSLPQLRAASPTVIVEHLGELRSRLVEYGHRLTVDESAERPASRRPVATVGALIYNEAGEVLLVRTRKWSGLWGIPGGKIEWCETSEDALRRELMEETGLQIDDIRFVLVQDAIQPPEFYRPAHFLLLNYTCVARGTQTVTLNDEAQDFRWLTVEAAFALDLNQPTRRLLEAVHPRPTAV